MNCKSVLRTVCAGASLMFLTFVSAQTVDPKIKFEVTESKPAAVTVSNSTSQNTPQTYVAYLASLKNGGGSELNKVSFKYTVSVTSNLTTATIDRTYPSMGTGCTPTGQSTIECFFGDGFAPGVLINAPVIVVAVPKFIDGSTAAARANQKITVTVTASFREGKSSTASSASVGTVTRPIVTPVNELSATNLDSLVVNGGGRFFTGANGKPTATDVQTTTVVFPALESANFSTVAIVETADNTNNNCIALNFFKTCYSTLLSAPDVVYSSGYLTETIKVFKDALVAGAASKVDTFRWWYTPTNSAGEASDDATRIELCGSATSPRTDGIPCQTKPGICYKTSNAPSPDLIDVCVWEFINRTNGRVNSYP